MIQRKTARRGSSIAFVIAALVAVLLVGVGSGAHAVSSAGANGASQAPRVVAAETLNTLDLSGSSERVASEIAPSEETTSEMVPSEGTPSLFVDLNGVVCEIPPFNGVPAVEINGGKPSFSEQDLAQPCFENYSQLDRLGRCGAAMAHVCEATMPTEERGDIQSVHPSGWQSAQYDFIEGGSLYNRGHLIGYQLTGENANEKNLITCTRFMNTEGMLPFENQIANYVKSTGQSVLLRVTPLFEGKNLVASGVVMEAASVEDGGASLALAVYCYNVQPGVSIDYATGKNEPEADALAASMLAAAEGAEGFELAEVMTSDEVNCAYVANLNTKKFHYPSCSSVSDMAAHNRWDYEGTREGLIDEGYVPCKRCNP